DTAAVAAQIHGPGGEKNQPLRQPPVEGQLGDLFLIYQLTDSAASCIDQIGVGLHGDLVADLAYLKDNRLAGELVDGQVNAFLKVGGEPGLVGCELVAAHGQAREEEVAIVA